MDELKSDSVLTEAELARFLGNIQVTEHGCWEWQGSLSNGYGYYIHGAKVWPAHRLSYIIFVAAIPQGMAIDHLCRNRTCVNPLHLEAVTTAENNRRKGLARQVEARHRVKSDRPYLTRLTFRDGLPDIPEWTWLHTQERQWWKASEIAARLRIDQAIVEGWCKRGKVHGARRYSDGSGWLIHAAELRRHIATCYQAQSRVS